MQRHLGDILDIAAQRASHAQHGLAQNEDQAGKIKPLRQAAASDRLEVAEVSNTAGAQPYPSEDELARMNLANVVASTNLLMNNAVVAHRNLDIIGEAVLSQAAALIFSTAASPQV